MSEYEEELFEAEPEVTEPQAEAQEPEAEAHKTEGEPTGEKQDDSTPEPEKPEAVKEDSADKESAGFKQALLDERRKRQELEDRLKAMETGKKPEADPDMFEDPDGWAKRMEVKFEQRSMRDRFDMSREMMSMFKDDYEQREQEFQELVKEDPSLIEKLKAASNPAKFAYETAVKAEKAKKLENIDEYEAQIRSELEAKIRAELEGEKAKEKEKLDAVTPSLAKQSSKGALNGSSWTGPTPLENIID